MKKIIALFLSALMLASMLVVPVFAEKNPSEEEIAEIFADLGFSTWGSGYFSCHMMNPEGDPAPDSVIHQYLQSSGLLKDYGAYDEQMGLFCYELPYTKYIEIVDSAFVNHSDMKLYLAEDYNEETGIVKWYLGGFGDACSWDMNEVYYASEDYIYATGVWVHYAYEDSYFDSLKENYDYIIRDGEKIKLTDTILLTLKREDGQWKILEYRECGYHILDNKLYDLYEETAYNRISFDATGAVLEATEDTDDYVTGFYANGSKWFTDGQTLSYSVTAKKGYELKKVILKDDKGTTELTGNNGVYIFAPKGVASFIVETEKIPVDINIEKPENNEVIKVSKSKTEVFAVVNQSVEDIVTAVSEDIEILKADGTKAEASDKIASGMQIVIKDEKGEVVDTKTVVVPGDVDGNAAISANDARCVLRASVKLDTLNDWEGAAANVDGNAALSANDARNILRASVNLENSADWIASLV